MTHATSLTGTTARLRLWSQEIDDFAHGGWLSLARCHEIIGGMGANPEVEDEIRRKLLDLAKEILKTMPQGNPIHFVRRLGLKSLVMELEGVIFEAGSNEATWEPEENVDTDLIKEFMEGQNLSGPYNMEEARLEQ
ncbi:hypothetical protein COP1_003459 [Malus domestica]